MLIILARLLLAILPVEFADPGVRDKFSVYSMYILSLAILLTLAGTIKKEDTVAAMLSKIILTVFVSFLPYAFLVISTFFDFCSWSDGKILYEKKTDPNIRIIERCYGCGAYDSSYPDFQVFRMTPVTSLFYWTVKADTTALDRSKWTRKNCPGHFRSF